MFSIDQNCHPLWDVLPKLQALALRGGRCTHFIEDIDTAFTAIGAGLAGGTLRLARERFYYRGGADWGAALFYCDFLGRLPVDLRDWETLTGRTVNVLARELGQTCEALYDAYSPGDNWQLIGPSYVGDREHHRVIGDLSVAECAPFLRELLEKARGDMLERFPAPDSRDRVTAWLAGQQTRLERLLARHAGGMLTGLYRDWMGEHLGHQSDLALTSDLFALTASPLRTKLLEVFLADYPRASGLYNRAIAESHQPLHPLDTDAGELPFFATLTHHGRLCRTGVFLEADALRIGAQRFAVTGGKLPLDALARAGVRCLAGKAILLVIQARLAPDGAPLAMPYRGSLYTPAAHRLADLLAEASLLPAPLAPIRRVRFHLLDQMSQLRTPISLPSHLHSLLGPSPLPACGFAEAWSSLSLTAFARLESFRTPAGRLDWQRDQHPADSARLDALDVRRRQLAAENPKAPEIRDLWKQVKALQASLLGKLVEQIALDAQVSQLDYWDSRGAIWPWCLALGGEAFYRRVLQEAEVYDEPAGHDQAIRDHYRPRIQSGRPHFDVLDWADEESQLARFAVLADNVPLAGRTLLDVGCGLGDLLGYLQRRGLAADYTGVDIVPEMVAAARRMHPDGQFLCADVFGPTPLSLSKTPDVVFCSGTFNLDLGNSMGFLARALPRLLALTQRVLVFNLLHVRTVSKYDQCVYHDPQDVLDLLSPLGVRARVIDDYLHNDFTVLCEKVNPTPSHFPPLRV
ncbi:MAG: class I SAM-dependent methyltransferase [Planctomycetota bacterium]|nr:class I SAM-dependent methyltransferase [Planctomycetota bacterium]